MRKTLLVLAMVLVAAAAWAAGVADAWVRQLTREGYERITISRTWLGRTRILAEKGEIEREIVLNSRTGEVLRDLSRHADGSFRLPFGSDDDPEDEKDEKDEEDERDEAEDEEDDNSGSGSSNSGSGSSNSGSGSSNSGSGSGNSGSGGGSEDD